MNGWMDGSNTGLSTRRPGFVPRVKLKVDLAYFNLCTQVNLHDVINLCYVMSHRYET